MRYAKSFARWSAVAMGLLGLVLFSRPAQAEWYVAGQVGANLPADLSNVQWSSGGASVSGNDLELQTSLVYGGKIGYYFEPVKWLGIETEVFNATPHVKQQDWIIGGIPLAPALGLPTIPGIYNRVLTWAPINLVVRYQAGAFEPYAGVGLGVFFSHLSASDFSSSSTDVGLNTQVGLRYRITSAIAMFGEWKYNWANIGHDNLSGTGLNVEADYRAHNFVVGVGYHFGN
ncbi:MAG: porin family protein [Nitrospira sp.]|nr:porin family protein [Nitrospira sp.]MDH4243036.1 porin family protein [Nitrospira sp.]MDH5320144.1 porin family protein [Nitrospira sp.]